MRKFRQLVSVLAADEHRLLRLQNTVSLPEDFPDELITEMDNHVQEARRHQWTAARASAGAQAKSDALRCAERVASLLVACGVRNGSDSDSEYVYESE